jgi:lambda repressor-like predicted transcriptional regulator
MKKKKLFWAVRPLCAPLWTGTQSSMWDCTMTSPRRNTDGGATVSVCMSPKAKRKPGESHWSHFGSSCTPQELMEHSVGQASERRDFRLVGGKLACTQCTEDPPILRTIAGHDLHFRTAHESLGVYTSFGAEESSAGGRVNPNVPKGRDAHRASLLKELKALGQTARQLTAEGYNLAELKRAGFTVKELLSCDEYNLEQLRAAVRLAPPRTQPLAPGPSQALCMRAPLCCLKLCVMPRAMPTQGVVRALKGAGISLEQIRQAGYTLADARKAGYSAKQLRSGFKLDSESPGPTLADLKAAGFMLADLKEAGYTLPELKVTQGASDY